MATQHLVDKRPTETNNVDKADKTERSSSNESSTAATSRSSMSDSDRSFVPSTVQYVQEDVSEEKKRPDIPMHQILENMVSSSEMTRRDNSLAKKEEEVRAAIPRFPKPQKYGARRISEHLNTKQGEEERRKGKTKRKRKIDLYPKLQQKYHNTN